jgi:hypothetical protein
MGSAAQAEPTENEYALCAAVNGLVASKLPEDTAFQEVILRVARYFAQFASEKAIHHHLEVVIKMWNDGHITWDQIVDLSQDCEADLGGAP